MNVFSSNILNLIQYIVSLMANRNLKSLNKKALKIDLGLVICTILIPAFLLIFSIGTSITLVPIFIILYIIFKRINTNAHNLYLEKESKEIESEILEEEKKEEEEKIKKGNSYDTIKYILILAITGLALFFIGDILGEILKSLCTRFGISEIILGILLRSNN